MCVKVSLIIFKKYNDNLKNTKNKISYRFYLEYFFSSNIREMFSRSVS